MSVGHEVTRANANDHVVRLSDLLGIKMTQGYSVYGDVPFNHESFVGFYGMGIPRGLQGTDVFLNLGAPMPDPTIFTAPVPRKAKVIHARIEFDDIANIYPTDIAIAAGMKETLIAIEESVKSLATEDRLKKIREERLSITRGINKKFETKKEKDAKANWNSSPVSWERASYEINKELDELSLIHI